MLRPAVLLASRPGPVTLVTAETCTSKLSPPESPHGRVGYNYAANWTPAAVELPSTGKVLLWAASSLRGHSPASSLLRSRPPLSGALVLSASRSCRLRLFPWHRRAGSHVPYESLPESHASCTPDTTWPGRRCPPCCSQSLGCTLVLMSSEVFRCLIGGSLALVSLIPT